MSKSALLAAYMDDHAPRKVVYHELDAGIRAVETRQDCEHLVALARAAKDIPPDREFRLVGFIPDTVFDKAAQEGWLNDKARIKAWLNDPENRDFRVWEGRL